MTDPALDDLFQAHKGSPAEEEDVGRVHRSEFLVRMFSPSLRRNVGDGTFQNLEQRLLDALAGDVPSDGRVFVLLRNLVDLVDIDNALLGALHVALGVLQQLQDDVFHVFAHVPRFGKGGGVDDGKGHVELPRQGLGKQRLAGAGRPDQQDIRLGQLDVAARPGE